jgi:hypothetical protein
MMVVRVREANWSGIPLLKFLFASEEMPVQDASTLSCSSCPPTDDATRSVIEVSG